MPDKRTPAVQEALKASQAEVLAFIGNRFPEAEIEAWHDHGDYIGVYLRIDDSRCWEVLDAVEPLLQQIAGQNEFTVGVVPLPAKHAVAV